MQMAGAGKRRISFVLKRNSSTATTSSGHEAPVHEELCDAMKLNSLLFATQIGSSTDMSTILDTVNKTFTRIFPDAKVVIYLNPEYAARYHRFLRKHSMENRSKRDKYIVSRLEIGFEKHLAELCGVRSLHSELDTTTGLDAAGKIVEATSASESGDGTELCAAESEAGAEDTMMALGCPIFSLLDNSFDKHKEMGALGMPLSSAPQRKKKVIAVCELSRDQGLPQFTEDDARLLASLCIHLGQALERACIESDLAKHLDWSRMMLKMSETLNSNLDAVSLIGSAIEMLQEALFAERGSMYLVDDTKSPPDLWTMVTGSTSDCDELRELRIPFGKGIAGYVAESREVVIIPDAYQDERFNRDVDIRTGLKTTSILCVPVFDSSRDLVAVIQMINKKDTEGAWTAAFDHDDVDILNAFSSHVSVALNNAKVTAKNKYNEAIANELLDKMFPRHITDKLKRSNELQALGQGAGAIRSTKGDKEPGAADRVISAVPREPIVEKYKKVFVFFSDIVSFTTLSMTWEPYEVVNLLNDLFTGLDKLAAKHGVYKLETIGDAYVACSNLPFMNQESEAHAAEQMARFALDATHMVDHFVTRSGKQIQIRAGVHCGPCFGGVVGLTMPRYCLMGDTMNTASRMESTGSPGKVHISESFKASLEGRAGEPAPYALTEFSFEDLGTMPVKGKGDMRTYFLNDLPSPAWRRTPEPQSADR